MWLQGTRIGTVTGSLRFINFPFIEQMPIGVLNNKGITFSSGPVLGNPQMMDVSRTQIGSNPSFRSIIEEKTRLIKNDKHEMKLSFPDSINSADRLNEQLQYTEKLNAIIFDIDNEADLMRA